MVDRRARYDGETVIRVVAWAVLVALALFQGHAQRFVISPDGVSYLDLSDGVVRGDWSRLLNLYWSPLYPFLIGLARRWFRVGPAAEIPLVHGLNVACFIAMIGAFAYALRPLRTLAAEVRGAALRGPVGLAAAYLLFGCFALTMTPVELTTPDILNAALAFVALGAMLRLHRSPVAQGREAVVLGLALGIGGLSKSFMIPWGAVCLVVLAVALRRRSVRPVLVAGAVWLAFVLPWAAALSVKAGRPTIGDTGRLTYAWFVNNQDAPALGGVPPGARTASTDSILPGSGISVDTAYTDPMWADPVRWNAPLQPRVSLTDQWKTLVVFHVFYVENFAPLLFLFLLIAGAPPGTRRLAWKLGWVVYVPVLIGLFAYAMIIVTTRYVMPFALFGLLTLLATTPIPRRVRPLYLLFGLAVPVGLEAMMPATAAGLALVASVIGGLLAALLVLGAPPLGWGTGAVIGLALTRVVLSPVFPSLLRVGAVGLVLLVWRASFAAVRRHRPVAFTRRVASALALLITVLLLFRLGIRLNQDRQAMALAGRSTWGNVPWNIARDLVAHGVTPGTRIALIGPHAESYWARTARLHIVASVPRNQVAAFWQLPQAAQDSLLSRFAASGATVAIATLGLVGTHPDTSWHALKYHGRMKWLRAAVH